MFYLSEIDLILPSDPSLENVFTFIMIHFDLWPSASISEPNLKIIISDSSLLHSNSYFMTSSEKIFVSSL